MNRMLYPQDGIDTIGFLASDSGFITGQTLNGCGEIIVH